MGRDALCKIRMNMEITVTGCGGSWFFFGEYFCDKIGELSDVQGF